jgi:hypothetical protein
VHLKNRCEGQCLSFTLSAWQHGRERPPPDSLSWNFVCAISNKISRFWLQWDKTETYVGLSSVAMIVLCHWDRPCALWGTSSAWRNSWASGIERLTFKVNLRTCDISMLIDCKCDANVRKKKLHWMLNCFFFFCWRIFMNRKRQKKMRESVERSADIS